MRNLALPLLFALAAACSESPTAVPAAQADEAVAVATRKAVARIVFIDKEHACECTQKAIDNTLAALNGVFGGKTLPIERIHLDTQRERLGDYVKLRALVAVPALYLFDADGGLVEVLQGESDEAKLRTYLDSHPPE